MKEVMNEIVPAIALPVAGTGLWVGPDLHRAPLIVSPVPTQPRPAGEVGILNEPWVRFGAWDVPGFSWDVGGQPIRFFSGFAEPDSFSFGGGDAGFSWALGEVRDKAQTAYPWRVSCYWPRGEIYVHSVIAGFFNTNTGNFGWGIFCPGEGGASTRGYFSYVQGMHNSYGWLTQPWYTAAEGSPQLTLSACTLGSDTGITWGWSW